MNITCYTYFEKLSDISKKMSFDLCNNSFNEAEKNISQSKEHRDMCLEYALRQFVTPIDREDIVSICFGLHSLNEALFDLSIYKNNFCKATRFNKESEELYNIICHISAIFKTKFSKDISDILSKIPNSSDFIQDRLQERLTVSNSIKSIICAQKLYDKRDECIKAARYLLEKAVSATIKNV